MALFVAGGLPWIVRRRRASVRAGNFDVVSLLVELRILGESNARNECLKVKVS